MNTKLILVVALALAVASAQNLQFNVNNLQVAKGSNAWQIGVPCSGAQSNYQYNCNTPANDWQFNNGYFTVPASYTANFGQEYVCNCQVADPLGQVLLQGALTFTWTQSGLSCVNNNWGYVAKAGAVGAAVLSRLGNLAGQISGGLSTGGFSIGGGAVNVFSGLPQCSDIDGYIQKGDCQSIITIVNQTVNGNTLTCDAKIAYLNDILGRICAAITVKKQSVANLTATIAYLTSQIQTITSQISTAQGNLNTLNTNLNQLNANLQNLQNLLSAAIANQSTCNANCAAIKTQINNLNTVIAQIQQYLNSLNSQLTSTTNAYNNYCQQVTDLQNQLAAAIANKNSASQNITILNSAISQWTGYLNGNQTNLNTLNGQYQQCTANCTTITTYINTLKQNITTVQAAIDQATCDSHHLSDNITAWQVTLANLQGQLSNSNILLSTFNTAVSSLQSLQVQIKQLILNVQYTCYSCQNVVPVPHPEVHDVCFSFGKNDWFNYLNSCYKAQPAQINFNFPSVNIEIIQINIYEPIFIQTYGSCFGNQITPLSQNFNGQTSFGFNGDFQCQAGYNQVAIKKGTIQSINAQQAVVNCDDGTTAHLNFGSCTRFEGQGVNFVPKVGHTIHWKGSQNSDSSYNLHHCTCY